MNNIYANQQWIYIALIFFGIIGYISFIRWRDRKWIENRFSGQKILAMSFGVFIQLANDLGVPIDRRDVAPLVAGQSPTNWDVPYALFIRFHVLSQHFGELHVKIRAMVSASETRLGISRNDDRTVDRE